MTYNYRFFDVDDRRMEFILPRNQNDRLKNTCFRGRRCQQAGNFFRWGNYVEFIRDSETRSLLSGKLNKLPKHPNVNQVYELELEYSEDVGWDSVVELTDLTSQELKHCEMRELNNSAQALFAAEDFIASKTNIVTIKHGIRHCRRWQVIVYTIYPGPIVPQLIGNMTKKHALVFVPWQCLGE